MRRLAPEAWEEWNPEVFAASPIFHAIADGCALYQGHSQWPLPSDYNAVCQAWGPLPETGGGLPLSFVVQNLKADPMWHSCNLYTPRTFLTGEIPTRWCNWHDFFSMAVWWLFPRFRAAMTRRLFAEFDAITPFPWVAPAPKRTPLMDVIVGLDEAGAALLFPCEGSREEARQHIQRHGRLSQCPLPMTDVWCVGHALYEEVARHQKNRVTAPSLFLVKPEGFDKWPLRQRREWVDAAFGRFMRDGGGLTREAEVRGIPLELWPDGQSLSQTKRSGAL